MIPAWPVGQEPLQDGNQARPRRRPGNRKSPTSKVATELHRHRGSGKRQIRPGPTKRMRGSSETRAFVADNLTCASLINSEAVYKNCASGLQPSLHVKSPPKRRSYRGVPMRDQAQKQMPSSFFHFPETSVALQERISASNATLNILHARKPAKKAPKGEIPTLSANLNS